MTALDPRYDRAQASAIIAELATGLFSGASENVVLQEITYFTLPMEPEPGSHLTTAQLRYLEKCMAPCSPSQVTSAEQRVIWTDSDGVPNTGFCGPSGLGPLVPIAVREAVLAMWRDLDASTELRAATAQLPDEQFAVLAASTTDHEPLEVFRIGIESAGRALAQHALVADQAGFSDPAGFAEAMRASRLYGVAASTWFWELQASSYRRGMIPARLEASGGRVRYTPETLAVLAAMKKRTLATAHTVMQRAMTDEGLSAAAAIRKYHTELDVVAKQYALLEPGTLPVCLAQMPNTVAGQRVNVLARALDAFTATVSTIMNRLPVTEVPATQPDTAAGGGFQIPDMNCRHCKLTITTVLEQHGADVTDVNLITKDVVASFASPDRRDSAISELRNSGYTVIAGGG